MNCIDKALADQLTGDDFLQVIFCDVRHARQHDHAEYDQYDLFLVMYSSKLIQIARIFPDDPEHKAPRLLECAGRPKEDANDPWYSGDFSTAYVDILAGCEGLRKILKEQG